MSALPAALRWLPLPLSLAGLVAGAALAAPPLPFERWQQLGLAGLALLAVPALDALRRQAAESLRERGQNRRVVIRINRRR